MGAAGRSTPFLSLKRRALAPLDRAFPRAWTRDAPRLRRAGAVAPAGPLRGPVHVSSDTPFAAGRLREMNKPAPLASGLGATL